MAAIWLFSNMFLWHLCTDVYNAKPLKVVFEAQLERIACVVLH